MEEVRSFLRKLAEGDLLPWKQQIFASTYFGLTMGQVEKLALEIGSPAIPLPEKPQNNLCSRSVTALSVPCSSDRLWWSWLLHR